MKYKPAAKGMGPARWAKKAIPTAFRLCRRIIQCLEKFASAARQQEFGPVQPVGGLYTRGQELLQFGFARKFRSAICALAHMRVDSGAVFFGSLAGNVKNGIVFEI